MYALKYFPGVVSVDNIHLPTMISKECFVEAQRYNVEHTIVHQDNASTGYYLINGKNS